MIRIEKHLDYALGYMGLDLFKEARRELALITPADRRKPDVLAVRLELTMATSAWPEAIRVAAKLARHDPTRERPWVAWAYALREQGRVNEALDTLSRAEIQITAPSPLVDYNLACYHCLLGDLAQARLRLKRACAREPSWKKEAASDPDLASLFRAS